MLRFEYLSCRICVLVLLFLDLGRVSRERAGRTASFAIRRLHSQLVNLSKTHEYLPLEYVISQVESKGVVGGVSCRGKPAN